MKKQKFIPFVALSLWFLLFVTSPIHACSVCFTEDGYLVRYAYYGTTLGLILLPAGLVTAFALWIRSAETGSDPAGPSE